MNQELDLTCSACGAAALGDDEFCESCGRALSYARDEWRHHVELDRERVAAVSDRGLVHDRNEDAVFVDAGERGVVAVVCDGVSASAAPQVASAVAANVIGQLLVAARDGDGDGDQRDTLVRALAEGDDAVLAVPWMPSGDREAPACTVVAALWDGAVVTIGWAGDSRAYWLGDEATLLTLDHSWAQEQVSVGAMSVSAAKADGRAHAITRWLGADAPTGEPSIVTWRPAGAGRLVLCTDGLWNHFATTDELAGLVATCPAGASALAVARELTRTALARGGHDNVTVAVADMTGEQP